MCLIFAEHRQQYGAQQLPNRRQQQVGLDHPVRGDHRHSHLGQLAVHCVMPVHQTYEDNGLLPPHQLVDPGHPGGRLVRSLHLGHGDHQPDVVLWRCLLHLLPLLLLLLPLLLATHPTLLGLAPFRRELQMELCRRGRRGAKAMATHHLHPIHLVLFGCFRRAHRLVEPSQASRSGLLSQRAHFWSSLERCDGKNIAIFSLKNSLSNDLIS